jgi:O-antigen/teichoic acid export membrane protein
VTEAEREERGNSLAHAAATTFSSGIFAAGLQFLNVLITSRQLGPEGRGSIAFLTTVAILGSQLASFGIEEATANIAGTEPERRRSLATNASFFALLFGGLAVLVLTVMILIFPAVGADSGAGELALVLGAIPVLLLQFYLQFLVRADFHFTITNLVALIAPVLNVVVNGIFVLTGNLSVMSAVATWVIGQVIATAVLVWYVHRRLAGFGLGDAALARRSAGFGVKAHLGRVMKTGNYRLDQWLLGAIAGPTELGLYSVAVAWTEALFFVPEALAAALRPHAVRGTEGDAASRAAHAFRVAQLLTLPLVLGVIIAAPLLCTGIFGPEFAGSVDQLRVLALGVFGIVGLKILANALVARGRAMASNGALLIAFGITVSADLLLIPSMGGLGVAIASTIAYTVGGIAALVVFVRLLGIPARAFLPGRADVESLLGAVRRRVARGSA